MTSTEKQNNSRLLYWKKIILTAESYEGTRVEWMRQHGIREGRYYYWHRILLKKGLLNDQDTSLLEGIELPPVIVQNAAGMQNEFVEYHAERGDTEACKDRELQGGLIKIAGIMVEKNGYRIHVGEGFSATLLCQVLEVIAHAE